MLIELFELVFRSPFSFIGSIGILIFLGFLFESLTVNMIRCFSRSLRTLNIICRGWPPAHLDADGDWNINRESETDATSNQSKS